MAVLAVGADIYEVRVYFCGARVVAGPIYVAQRDVDDETVYRFDD